MKIISGLVNYQELDKSIVTIGTFDGVHIGHQKIIKKLIKNKADKKAIMLTFYPHPRFILENGENLKLLNTIEEKNYLLNKLGLDFLIIEPFTKEFSRLTALDFTRNILVNKLNISKLIVGYDHRFGRNREGTFKQLEEFGKFYHFKVKEISVKDVKDVAVSSTKIRKALHEGKIEIANSFLGYAYLLTGKVIHGKGLGKKWNYPTINLQIDKKHKLVPKTGVYLIKSEIKNIKYFGIMNIGYRPTIDGKYQTIEVHLLDFNANLYGKNIQVGILKRLRDEQKFNTLELLFKQIQLDEIKAKNILLNNTKSDFF